MPSPRPPDLDAQGRPVVAQKPPDLDANGQPEQAAVTTAPAKPQKPAAPIVAAPFAYLGNPAHTQAQAQNFKDAAGGVRAGAARTVFGGGDLLRRGWNAVVPESWASERIINTPEVQAAMTPPDSPVGHGAMMVEQGAEFALPLAGVTKLVKAKPLLARATAEAAAAAGVAGLQTAGDPAQMAVAGGLGMAAPVVGAGVKAGIKAGAGLVGRAAAGAQEGGVGGAVASLVRTAAPVEPKRMVVQALKPRATHTGFEASLDTALPELKAMEQELGKPIGGLDDLHEAVTKAKRKVWQQYEQVAGPMREMGATVDLSPVAESVVASIPKKLRLENPQAAARLEAVADAYRQRFSIADAEQLLKETNAELDSFYAKYPHAQRSAMTANPEVAHTVAQGKSLRDAIYKALDGQGEPGAARELKRRYGALSSVEEEVYRRSNVAKRQQPESLSEQIGKVRAASEMARGIFKMARGQFISGGADIVGARAGRDAAKFLKEQQTSDALIRRAFAAFDGAPVPVPMPQQPRISGLLGQGARPMPAAPDPSFVRGVRAQPATVEGRALPPGRDPIPQPPAPDPSFVRGVRGEYPRREPRALMGPAQPQPKTLPSSGRIFNMPGDVQAPKPDPSGGGSIKAAPIAHEINPMVPVKKGGLRVSQFSGDPAAKAAPVVDREDVRAMLGRMLEDLQTFSPERGRLVRDAVDPNSSIYAHGGPGSAVGDDVRVISEQNVGNSDIMRAISELLEGRRPTNRLHTAALDAALGYLEKRPGYRGPVVPGADDVAGPVEDDGFAAFSDAVDDIAAQPDDDSLHGLIARTKATKGARMNRASELSAKGQPVAFTSGDGRKALAGPDMSKPGRFRLTRFEDGQPIGHTEHQSLQDAILRAFEDGYEPR